MAPDPTGQTNLKLPDTFMVQSPTGYFTTVIEARLLRQAAKTYWEAAHRSTRPPKAGENEEPSKPEGDGTKGGGKKSSRRTRSRGAKAREPTPKPGATRTGTTWRLLTPAEVTLSVQHAPVDQKGKPKCWDAACHLGCAKTAETCAKSHAEGIRDTPRLHWTVRAQLIKRGGVKGGARIPTPERSGRIKQLREEAKSDKQQKVQEGIDGAKARRGGEAADEGARPPAEPPAPPADEGGRDRAAGASPSRTAETCHTVGDVGNVVTDGWFAPEE